MDYAILQILLDPAKTDPEMVEMLNARDVPVPAAIQTRDIKEYLMVNGKWLTLKMSSDLAAMTTVEALTLFDVFDCSRPEVASVYTAMVGALKAELILSQGQHDDLIAMMSTTTSIAERDLGRPVTVTDIDNARAYG